MSADGNTKRAWGGRGQGWIAAGGLVLLLVGVTIGAVLSRRTPEPPTAEPPTAHQSAPTPQPAPGAPAPTPAPIPAPAPSPQLQALVAEIEREDAPTLKILELARAALQQEQFALAIPAYRRVLNREPKNPEALTSMGFILFRANHVDQALARVDDALKADPTYALAHWHRANMLYRAKKDMAGAKKSIEQFLALTPPGPGADRARALLAEIGRSGKGATP